MKKIKFYEKKLRSLLGKLRKVRSPEIAPGVDRIYFMIGAILQADGKRKAAAKAISIMKDEFVDLNDLRVSPARDLVEYIGRDHRRAREKAEEIVAVLNNLFARTNDISLDDLETVPKRDLRRCLQELGLDPYAESLIRLVIFGHPAIPVDQTLLACLAMDGYTDPKAELAEVQSLLERLVAPKDCIAAHGHLRAYAEKQARRLPKPPPPEEPAVPVTAELEKEDEKGKNKIPAKAPVMAKAGKPVERAAKKSGAKSAAKPARMRKSSSEKRKKAARKSKGR